MKNQWKRWLSVAMLGVALNSWAFSAQTKPRNSRADADKAGARRADADKAGARRADADRADADETGADEAGARTPNGRRAGGRRAGGRRADADKAGARRPNAGRAGARRANDGAPDVGRANITKTAMAPGIGGAGLAQGPAIEKKAAQVTISLASPDIQVFKKAPIATERFELLDPQTKQPIAATAILTLPDGRKYEAAKYYAELNDVEKGMNDLGYSLRTMPANLVIQKSVVDTAKFTRQAQGIKSVGPPLSPQALEQRFGAVRMAPDGQKMLGAGELKADAVKGIQTRIAGKKLSFTNNELKFVTQTDAAGAPKGVMGDTHTAQAETKITGKLPGTYQSINKSPEKFHKEQNWAWAVGGDTFEAHFNGNVTADATAEYLSEVSDAAVAKSNSEYSLSASTQAGGKVLGRDVTLLDVTAKFLAPANASKSLNASSRIQVLGITVYNLNENLPGSWEKHDTFAKTLRYGVPFYIPVGPVVLGGEIGIQGEAGLRYNISMGRNGVAGGVGPYLNTSVYGEIGLNLGIVGAGVGASMTLMDASLNLNSTVVMNWFGGWVFSQNLYVDYDLKMLKGNVYAYAFVYLPAFSIPPWKKQQWEHSFFDWGGFDEKGTLVNVNNVEIMS